MQGTPERQQEAYTVCRISLESSNPYSTDSFDTWLVLVFMDATAKRVLGRWCPAYVVPSQQLLRYQSVPLGTTIVRIWGAEPSLTSVREDATCKSVAE